MSDAMLVFGWGSPIGIGIFLLCLGGMIYLLSRAGKKTGLGIPIRCASTRGKSISPSPL